MIDNNAGLLIQLTSNNEIQYSHTVKAKETLYSLARYFKLPVQDLMQINNIAPGEIIGIGTTLKIPIRRDLIVMNLDKPKNGYPIYYSVRKKETLFKLSHVYFPQTIQDLINRNGINSFSLNENQKIIIGWWIHSSDIQIPFTERSTKTEKTILTHHDEPMAEIKDDTSNIVNRISELLNIDIIAPDAIKSETEVKDLPTPTIDTLISSTLDTAQVILKLNKTKGIAYWDKSGNDYENLFVMHNIAKQNSYITLHNPLTGKKIVAKVLMKIPEGIYNNDIDIIITPAVAKNLGALDSRFRIEMDYYE